MKKVFKIDAGENQRFELVAPGMSQAVPLWQIPEANDSNDITLMTSLLWQT